MNRQTLIQKLKEDITQGHVVIIAGTGVSVAACENQLIENHPVASWPGLLLNGLEYCRSLGVADQEDVELLGNQIKSKKANFLISAAEDISQRLQAHSPGTYRGWLNDTVGKLVLKHREILDALTALPGVLATLNYDGLIEQALQQGGLARAGITKDDEAAQSRGIDHLQHGARRLVQVRAAMLRERLFV
jgi:hypothetical protein